MDPRRQQINRYVLEDYVYQFRKCQRIPNESVGEFVGRLATLYSNAVQGGITEVEAIRRLIRQLPPQWSEWAEHLRSDMCVRDAITDAEIIDFLMYVHVIITKWIMMGAPPQNDNTNVPVPPPPVPPVACRNDAEAGPSRARVQTEIPPPGFEKRETVVTPTPREENGRMPSRKPRMRTMAPTRVRININEDPSDDSDPDEDYQGSEQDSS